MVSLHTEKAWFKWVGHKKEFCPLRNPLLGSALLLKGRTCNESSELAHFLRIMNQRNYCCTFHQSSPPGDILQGEKDHFLVKHLSKSYFSLLHTKNWNCCSRELFQIMDSCIGTRISNRYLYLNCGDSLRFKSKFWKCLLFLFLFLWGGGWSSMIGRGRLKLGLTYPAYPPPLPATELFSLTFHN